MIGLLKFPMHVKILEAARGRRACTRSLIWYFYVNCPSLYQSNSLAIYFITLHYYDMKYVVFFATSCSLR
jgi:hypothetical protein